jgi:hypothetical protein
VILGAVLKRERFAFAAILQKIEKLPKHTRNVGAIQLINQQHVPWALGWASARGLRRAL